MKAKKNTHPSVFVLMLLALLAFSPVRAQAAMKLAKTSLTLKAGNAYVLRLSGNSKGLDVKWKSSKKKVVSVRHQAHNRVVLTANKAGKANIVARVDGQKLTCAVRVKKNKRFPSSLTLLDGDSFTFTAEQDAEWTVSKKKRGTLSLLSKNKKAIFTAAKTGKCTVTALAPDKEYVCRVKIIREDGATKADLAEEAALKARADLTDSQKGILTSLAYYAASRVMGADGMHNGIVSASDLTDNDKAFLLYVYQYKADDERITSDGEYHIASPQTMAGILNELFGSSTGSGAYTAFSSTYVEKSDMYNWYMSGTGDFGDAGPSYFTAADDFTRADGKVSLSGRVMIYNKYAETYIHTYNYTAEYLETAEGVFQFSRVVITNE